MITRPSWVESLTYKRKALAFAIVLAIILVTIPPDFNKVATADSPTQAGLSGYATSTQGIQNVIDAMDMKGLTIYRISFTPQWYTNPSHPYNSSLIQYFLDNSNYTVIVDFNHQYPPSRNNSLMAQANWDLIRNSTFEVLATWPNNSRVAIEPINEYTLSDFYVRMQQLVTEIRDAGYTNMIVINKWDQRWTKINDPLDNTYQGYHFYFNHWSVSGAISEMKKAQSRGIKIINTEIGADDQESKYYTLGTVNEVNLFLNQSASLGIGNCVWMVEDLDNWQRYQTLGLTFPNESPPVRYRVDLNSQQNNTLSSNLGSTNFDSMSLSLPNVVLEQPGTFQIVYNPPRNYVFSEWVTSGLVSVQDSQNRRTNLTVSGDGNLTAIYRSMTMQYNLHVEVNGLGSTNASSDTVWNAGANVSVAANPDIGWALNGWLLNGSSISQSNPCMLTMDANYNLTAVFVEVLPEQYQLAVEVAGSGVTNTTGTTKYSNETEVGVLATAAEGWDFSQWLLNGSNAGTQNPVTIVVDGNYNLTALFIQHETPGEQYSLTVNWIGNGSVTRSPDQAIYTPGTVVELTALTVNGYSFTGWSGDLQGTANPVTVIMDGNKSVNATFTANPVRQFTLTVNIFGSGSVTKYPDNALYDSGSVVTLTANAAADYVFSGWSGALSGTANIANITVNGDTIVDATFVPETVHLFADGFESGKLLGWGGSDGGATVSTASPHEGTYSLRCSLSFGVNNGWSGAYKSITGTNPVSLSAEVNLNSPPNTDNEDQWILCYCASTSGNALVYAGVRQVSGVLYWAVWYVSSGTTLSYQISSIRYSAGWHNLELDMYRGTSSDGWVRFSVDGVVACSATNLDNDGRALNYARVGFSYSDARSSSSSIAYIDNVTIDTAI